MQFRPDGKLQEQEIHNPDGSIAQSRNEYDEAGRLIEARFWMGEGPATKALYSYDGEGRLVRVVAVSADGFARDAESHSYDGSGRRTKVQFLEPQKPNVQYSFGIEGTDHGFGGNGAATITTVFDANGKPAEALFHDANQLLLQRVSLTWNAAGNLLTEEQHLSERALFGDFGKGLEDVPPEARESRAELFKKVFGAQQTMSVTTHVYDHEGRPVERTTRHGQLGEDRTTFLYDAHGNPEQETTYHVSREMSMDDEGNLKVSRENSHTQHTRFEYRYDAQGNWTERIVWGRLEPNPNFERSNVERREIEYYAE